MNDSRPPFDQTVDRVGDLLTGAGSRVVQAGRALVGRGPHMMWVGGLLGIAAMTGDAMTSIGMEHSAENMEVRVVSNADQAAKVQQELHQFGVDIPLEKISADAGLGISVGQRVLDTRDGYTDITRYCLVAVGDVSEAGVGDALQVLHGSAEEAEAFVMNHEIAHCMDADPDADLLASASRAFEEQQQDVIDNLQGPKEWLFEAMKSGENGALTSVSLNKDDLVEDYETFYKEVQADLLAVLQYARHNPGDAIEAAERAAEWRRINAVRHGDLGHATAEVIESAIDSGLFTHGVAGAEDLGDLTGRVENFLTHEMSYGTASPEAFYKHAVVLAYTGQGEAVPDSLTKMADEQLDYARALVDFDEHENNQVDRIGIGSFIGGPMLAELDKAAEDRAPESADSDIPVHPM